MRAPLPVMTHAQRTARAQAKAEILLKFLGSGEVYTTADIASSLLQIDRSRAAACLKSLEQAGALKSEAHEVRARVTKLFGITPHGLALAGCFDNPHFELGRTNPSWITHRLATQRMRIAAEAAGWTDWTPERAILNQGLKLKKVPDAAATDPAGRRVAVEIERHCKTPKRYSEIIVAYLLEIKAGRYQEVHYVCPTGTEKLIEKSFSRIESVKFNGEVVKLEAKHRARFKFFSFDTWPPVPAKSEAANG